jgi:hypothetical protein
MITQEFFTLAKNYRIILFGFQSSERDVPVSYCCITSRLKIWWLLKNTIYFSHESMGWLGSFADLGWTQVISFDFSQACSRVCSQITRWLGAGWSRRAHLDYTVGSTIALHPPAGYLRFIFTEDHSSEIWLSSQILEELLEPGLRTGKLSLLSRLAQLQKRWTQIMFLQQSTAKDVDSGRSTESVISSKQYLKMSTFTYNSPLKSCMKVEHTNAKQIWLNIKRHLAFREQNNITKWQTIVCTVDIIFNTLFFRILYFFNFLPFLQNWMVKRSAESQRAI